MYWFDKSNSKINTNPIDFIEGTQRIARLPLFSRIYFFDAARNALRAYLSFRGFVFLMRHATHCAPTSLFADLFY
jgi:hypothetical protein